MSSLVLGFRDIGKTKIGIAGGKGANLAELARIEGIHVPDGFCVSTEAFQRAVREASSIHKLLDRLSLLKVEERAKIVKLSSEIREVIEGTPIPRDISKEITRHLSMLDEHNAFAIRSSATAEDLPAASFAGQHDTYLNIIGEQAILSHISKCWASLFTERAVTYRLQNGFDHHKVRLAVVVQKMVFPQASGILFTADPVTSNRKVSSIDAGFGLGEALVSGIVNADIYKVCNGKLVGKTISTKKLAVRALRDGGTKEQRIEPERQNRQVLTAGQILQLERLGRKIEKHFGCPQDIEWCLVDDAFSIVQTRPITTLYPIPEAEDQDEHVYVSVGHNQMMTDAMKPLGISFFLLTTAAPMHEAGGRLFVDVSRQLASPESRKKLLQTFGQSDPLMHDALKAIVRQKFIKSSSGGKVRSAGYIENVLPWSYLKQFENNPAIVSDLIKSSQASIEKLKQQIRTRSGADLFDFILEDIQQLRKTLAHPQSWEVMKVGLYALLWINGKMMKWLGERNAADILSQSAPNNVTSEMGLALLGVADVIRPYPDLIEYLRRGKGENFLDGLEKFKGGREARDALSAYLDKYGMRCAGEIDIARTRWSEKPATLVPAILNHIKNSEPHAGVRKFEKGRQQALKKEQELLGRLMLLPGGKRKARETKRMISLLRTFIGYREYPKYGMISRYFIYKQALLKEAERLAQVGVLHEKEDIYYLSFEELREVVRTNKLDHHIIDKRNDDHQSYEKLTPPRVITSDGEIIAGKYKRENLPAEALVGLPVSSGVTEGRARVILNMAEADLEDGDILVTTFTDPSWTPLFLSIKGLVTEVGGQMTHGAVIAREYGLPAVVGVENATKLIKDGQRIRVHGTGGYVEILQENVGKFRL